jgi:serine protease Do
LIAPGTKVVAVIFREGDEQDLTVEVGGLSADEVARVNTGVAADGSVSILGMRLVEGDPAELSSIGLSGGVAVSQVDRGSPADEAGVMTGDVLTRLGNQPVGRIEDLDGLAEQLLPGSSVPARLIRGRSPLFIGIRIPESD